MFQIKIDNINTLGSKQSNKYPEKCLSEGKTDKTQTIKERQGVYFKIIIKMENIMYKRGAFKSILFWRDIERELVRVAHF